MIVNRMGIQPHSHLTGIASFVSAVGLGSFTAAAERLGLSKSAVAKNVARLEERLGTRLLERTTRRLGLTADGHAYHETCLRILGELEHAEAQLASRRQEPSGILRVSLPATFGPLWIVPMLLEIVKDFPQLSLDASFSDRRVDLVEEGIDLAVRIGELEDVASLMARKIGVQDSQICASPAYIEARGKLESISDLARHDCLGETRGERVLPWHVREADGSPTSVAIKPRHIITSGEGLLSAAIQGAGLAYLPTWLISDAFKDGKLESACDMQSVNDRPIHLVWPCTRDVLPKIRLVIDELARVFSPHPPWKQG